MLDRNNGEPGTDWAIDTGTPGPGGCKNTIPAGRNAPDLTCLYNAIGLTIPQSWAFGASQQYKTAINYVGPEPWTNIKGFATTLNYKVSDDWTAKILGSQRYIKNFDYENFSGTAYNIFSGKNYNEQDEETLEAQLLFNGKRWTGTNGVFQYNDDRRADRQNWLQNELKLAVNPALNAAAIAYLTANGFGTASDAAGGPALGGNGNVNQLVYNYSTGWALFSEWSYKITDAFTFTAGARYNSDHVVVTNEIPAYPLPVLCCEPPASTANLGQVPGSVQQKLNFHNTAPKAAFQYQWTPDVMTYFSYAQGFDRGGASTTNPPGGGAPLVIPYEPETLDNWEVGLRSDWLDHRLRFNLTVFYDQYKDFQVAVDVNKINVTRNGGTAVTKGVELESEFQIVQQLQWTLSGSYDNARITQLAPGTTANISVGQVLAYAPERSLATGLAYDIPIGGPHVTARADYGWNSDEYTTNDFTNRSYIPAFGLMNARITYYPGNEKWDAEVSGTNVLLSGCSTSAKGLPTST